MKDQLVTLEAQYEANKQLVRSLESKRDRDLTQAITNFFESILLEEDEIKVCGEYVEFTRPQEGFNYKKNYFEVRFKTDWRTAIATSVEASVYSSNGNNDWELSRLITVGKGAQIILDCKEDILDKYNTIVLFYKESIDTANKNSWDNEKEVSKCKDSIRQTEIEEVLKRVEIEGIEFSESAKERYNKYPALQTGYNDSVTSIKALKILSKTSSGKSANIQVTQEGNRWDDLTQEYVKTEHIRTFPLVRMSYIVPFILEYKDRIKA